MKFTTMQSALAVGALSAVTIPALADNASGAPAELVLYVVNTTNGTAYSRGLQINMNNLAITGAFSASGYTSTFTGNISAGSVAEMGTVTAESVAHGFTTGYGSQNVLSINYTLPTILADASLTSFLSVGGAYKWSIQSAGNGAGNGANFSRRFITTSASSYDNGTNVTNTNLGMAGTDANAWQDMVNMVLLDNAANPSTTNGDGTSITNSNYLSYVGAGGGTASNWFSTATTVPAAINALNDLGSISNVYEVVSCCGATQTGGSKVWVFTLNDVTMDAYGNLNASVSPPAHYVIPTISGLGDGKCVVLNDGSTLNQTQSFCNNGPTPFNEPLTLGANYHVSVTGQPNTQVCMVSNVSGTMGNANVTNVSVSCTNTWKVGGSVTGLSPGESITLLNNGGDVIPISSNGVFTFPVALPSGSGYLVSIGTQPANETCFTANSIGTVSDANVTNISITCITNTYSISGTVSGLGSGNSLALQNNGGDVITISANGSFNLPTDLPSGYSYSVSIASQPANQFCSVINGSGVVLGANVSNIGITCGNPYTVGGTLSGLESGKQLILSNNGNQSLLLSTNGSFAFATPIASGASYSVGVAIQPSGQTCLVSNGSGTVTNNVTSVNVTCSGTYTVAGSLLGLRAQGLVLRLNSTSLIIANGATSFRFATALTDNTPYSVSVGIQPVGMICSVNNGSGVINASNITNVSVTCNATYTVSGSINGLTGSGLILKLNGGANKIVSSGATAFTFSTGLVTGTPYDVTIQQQPAGQTCLLFNAYGTIGSSNVTGVNLSCTDNTYTIGGTISGLTAPGLVLQLNRANNLSVASSTTAFSFSSALYAGQAYVVTVSNQPIGEGCTVTNGNGTVNNSDVTNVVISCLAIPVPSVSYSRNPNQVVLSWLPVSGATSYQITKDTAGSGVYSPICQSNSPGDTACVDAYSKLTDMITANYKVAACNAYGCAVSVPVAAFTTQAIQYLKASNNYASNLTGYLFGTSLALSADGNTLAVGATGEDSYATGIDGDQLGSVGNACNSGAVYVFTRSGTTWAQQAYVKASNTDCGDGFGWSVALSADGNTMAVGASGEASLASGIDGNQLDNSAANAGAVYVFTRSDTTWAQQAYVKASNPDAGDAFGGMVALSADGGTLAVGALGESSGATGINGNQADNSAPVAGAVYVYTRSGTSWSQQAYIKASNTNLTDRFGSSVALSADGSALAVGAWQEASAATGINGNQLDNGAGGAGAVYVFTRTGTTWSQQAYIKASNTDANDDFGYSVALSADGSTLAVGATGESSGANGINGNQADNSAYSSGAVYLFTRSGTTWAQQAYIKSSNTNFFDQFGSSLTLSADGNTLAVAAINEASAATGINGNQLDNSAGYAGAVYVFTRSGTTWSQRAYIKASNTNANDYFGDSVALSADGSTLAVGAWGESSAATGINGNQTDNRASDAGAVYVY